MVLDSQALEHLEII